MGLRAIVVLAFVKGVSSVPQSPFLSHPTTGLVVDLDADFLGAVLGGADGALEGALLVEVRPDTSVDSRLLSARCDRPCSACSMRRKIGESQNGSNNEGWATLSEAVRHRQNASQQQKQPGVWGARPWESKEKHRIGEGSPEA